LTVLLLASFALVGCNKNADGEKFPDGSSSSSVSSSSPVGGEETPPVGGEEDGAVKYQITYQWQEYGTMYEGIGNFPEATTKGVSVPTEYVEGETLRLPKLNPWRKNAKIVYEFDGWYYDEDLKNRVENDELSATQKGDITLYAKFIPYIS
jgi:uncharacterized repeat protein (TIGR02543 family)